MERRACKKTKPETTISVIYKENNKPSEGTDKIQKAIEQEDDTRRLRSERKSMEDSGGKAV